MAKSTSDKTSKNSKDSAHCLTPFFIENIIFLSVHLL